LTTDQMKFCLESILQECHYSALSIINGFDVLKFHAKSLRCKELWLTNDKAPPNHSIMGIPTRVTGQTKVPDNRYCYYQANGEANALNTSD